MNDVAEIVNTILVHQVEDATHPTYRMPLKYYQLLRDKDRPLSLDILEQLIQALEDCPYIPSKVSDNSLPSYRPHPPQEGTRTRYRRTNTIPGPSTTILSDAKSLSSTSSSSTEASTVLRNHIHPARTRNVLPSRTLRMQYLVHCIILFLKHYTQRQHSSIPITTTTTTRIIHDNETSSTVNLIVSPKEPFIEYPLPSSSSSSSSSPPTNLPSLLPEAVKFPLLRLLYRIITSSKLYYDINYDLIRAFIKYSSLTKEDLCQYLTISNGTIVNPATLPSAASESSVSIDDDPTILRTTFLHLLCRYDCFENIWLCIEKGKLFPCLYLRDSLGRTPAQIAALYEYLPIADYLIETEYEYRSTPPTTSPTAVNENHK